MKKTKFMQRILSFLLCAALLMSNIPLTLSAAGTSLGRSTGTGAEADAGTADSWKSMLGTGSDGNRYSGRIWSDKSVFTGNSVLLGDTGIGAMTNDSDFMVVYSALGSTTSISSTKTITGALDVVVVLDNSLSMAYAAGSSGTGSFGNGSNTRLKAVTEAANGLIDDILMNSGSRLAVVTYSEGAETLLPLDYYEKGTASNVLTVNNYSYGYGFGSSSNGRMTASAVSKTTGKTVSNSNGGYGGNTNLQAGIDLAMDILLDAGSTTGRAPVVIVLTDGVADSAVDQGWWEVDTNEADTDNDTIRPSTSTITAGVALSTLLNAAYKSSQVEKKYGVNPAVYGIGVDLGTTSDAFVVMNPKEAFKSNSSSTVASTAYGWYTQWYNGTDYTQTERVSNRQFSWDFSLPPGLSATEQATLKATVNNNINYVDKYYNVSAAGTALEETFTEIVQHMNQQVFHPITDTIVIGGEATSTPLTYVDFIGDYMEVKKVNKVTVFGKEYNVVKGITTTKETAKGDGTYEVTATTTYIVGADGDIITNPIMGTNASINECVTIELIETYTAVQTEDAFVKRSVSDQQLWVYIKETALPLIYDEIVDKDGTITYKRTEAQPIRVYYEVGVTDDIKAADGTIMVSRISADYLAKNTGSDGKVAFYAGQYGQMNGSQVVDADGNIVNQTADGVNYFYRTGDAHMSATPSQANRYYFHVNNQGIFTAVSRTDNGTIQWDNSEFGVLWEEGKYELTWMNYAEYVQYNNDLANGIDHQVYNYVNFYRPKTAGALEGAGEKATYLAYAKWSQMKNAVGFYDNKNEVYINYDEATNKISVGESGNCINVEALPSGVTVDTIISTYVQNVAAYVGSGAKEITAEDIYAMVGIGSLRMPRLSHMAKEKVQDETNTAYYAYVPTRARDDASHTEHVGELVVWLGNNGRLDLDPTQGLSLTKQVDKASDKTDAPTNFNFTVTLSSNASFDSSAISATDRYGKKVSGWEVVDGNSGYTCTITGTLADGESVYLINLPAGVNYTVTETNADKYYDVVFGNGSGTIVNNQITAVTATNSAKEFADLFITKEIAHSRSGHTVPANVLRDSIFTISVDFGTALAGKRFDMIHSGDSSLNSVTVDTDGVNEFVIKHGETIQIIDLPVGAQVSVTETNGAGSGTNFVASYRSRNHSGIDSDNDGTVKIMVDQDSTTHDAATVVITNTYTPNPTTVKLDVAGTKIFKVENATRPEATFKFEVQKWDGNAWVVINKNIENAQEKTATVQYSQGDSEQKTFTIENVLKDIIYTETGSWAYQIVEVIPNDNNGKVQGVTYDRTLYTFTVVVTDNNGTLVAEVRDLNGNIIRDLDSDNDLDYSVTFTNTYHTAPISIDIVKDVVNKSGNTEISKAGFKFTAVRTNAAWEVLTGSEAAALTVTSDAVGEARLTATYTTTGTYHYVVSEWGTDGNGWTYSKAQYRVSVTVTPKDGGGLASSMTIEKVNDTEGENATVNGNSGTIIFKNIYDPADVSLSLDQMVNKVLSGRELLATDEFKFELYENGDRTTVLATGELFGVKQSDGSYQVKFDKGLTFETIGIYNYDIVEVKGGEIIDGVHYDPTIYDMVVEVTDNGEGALVARYYFEDATTQTVTFTNVYRVSGTATLDLSGLKTLKNHPLSLGEFTFNMVVTEGDNIVRTTTTANHTGGEIVFPTITYTAANVGKEYTYTITEVVPEGAVNGVYQGITYDSKEYEIKVKVVDDGKGGITLETTTSGVTLSEDKTKATFAGLNFENTYNAAGTTGQIVAIKQMDGRPLLNTDKFTFVVYEGDKKVAEAKNDGQNILFEINYDMDDVGEHVYEVREVKQSMLGVTYDSSAYKVIVHVVDDGLGQIHAYITYADGDILFTNKYHRQNAEVEIFGKKQLEGRDLVEGEFIFALYRADEDFNLIGDAISKVTNDADGNFAFGHASFSSTGTYHYMIVEEAGSAGGVDYDRNQYKVTIKVEDNINYDGKMSTTVNIVDSNGKTINVSDTDGSVAVTGIVFNNIYTVDMVSVDLTLEGMLKELTGRNQIAGEFTFEVKDAAGEVVSTGKNTAEGKITFDKKLEFTEKGNYTFTIIEVAGDDDNITYDAAVYTMKVTVTDDGKGTLTAEVTYGTDDKGKAPVFKNEYTPDPAKVILEALKELVGRDLKAEEFTFEVKDEAGKVVATGKNDADGKIVFDEIKLAVGEYSYTISEVIGEEEDTIYDKTAYKVKVEVTDADKDGVLETKITYLEGGVKFINEHYEGVDTGDNSQMILWGAMAVLCVVAVGALVVIRKKMK